MNLAVASAPTLWRTCRVLANRTRLRILGLLIRESELTVSAVARELNLTLPVASQSLRALEARGLLTVRRLGGRVKYQVRVAPAGEAAQDLIKALRFAFRQDSGAVGKIFKLATAFTQPRRIEIYRALKSEPQSYGQLKAVTRMSARALVRHLSKLEARGFVKKQQGKFAVSPQLDGLERVLAQLALG